MERESELESILISETEASEEFRNEYPEVERQLIEGEGWEADDWEFAEAFGDRYQGKFETERDYAIHIVEDVFGVRTDTFPLSCIDFDKVWRELRIEGEVALRDRNGYCHIFSVS